MLGRQEEMKNVRPRTHIAWLSTPSYIFYKEKLLSSSHERMSTRSQAGLEQPGKRCVVSLSLSLVSRFVTFFTRGVAKWGQVAASRRVHRSPTYSLLLASWKYKIYLSNCYYLTELERLSSPWLSGTAPDNITILRLVLFQELNGFSVSRSSSSSTFSWETFLISKWVCYTS